MELHSQSTNIFNSIEGDGTGKGPPNLRPLSLNRIYEGTMVVPGWNYVFLSTDKKEYSSKREFPI